MKTIEKKTVIRVGDKIRIVTPTFFVRCGYPWTKEYAKENLITKADKEELRAFVGRLAGGCTPDLSFNIMESDACYEKVLDALAWGVLKKNRYGGKERSIHTEDRPNLVGRFFTVEEKKVVHTGTYVYGSRSYEGECDPPYLSGMKAHVILTLDTHYHFKDGLEHPSYQWGFPLKIEACNVERVTE